MLCHPEPGSAVSYALQNAKSHETPEASGLRCSTPAKIRKCGFTRRLGGRGGVLLIFFTSAQNGRERKIPTAIAVRAPFV